MDLASFVIGMIGAVATVGSVIVLFIKSRGENQNSATNAKTALNALIDARVEAQLKEAWKEIEDLKTEAQDCRTKIEAFESRETRRNGAITRILRAIASQWPKDVPGPNLNPADIREIEETIPAEWIRNKSPDT